MTATNQLLGGGGVTGKGEVLCMELHQFRLATQIFAVRGYLHVHGKGA